MRWDRLFADLEAQFEQAERAELHAELADRIRGERASIRLVDRLRGSMDRLVRVQTFGAAVAAGSVRLVGADWVLLDTGHGGEAVIPLAAVCGVVGLGEQVVPPASAGAVESRLGLGYVLRVLARNRFALRLVLPDGRTLTGTIDGVGADYFELAEHLDGEVRRPAAVRAMVAVPFSAVAVINRA